MAPMPHLLIVDDADDIRLLLTNFFKKHSHTVTVGVDGVTVLAPLERHSFFLVTLDVRLGGEVVFSLCQAGGPMARVGGVVLAAMADHSDRAVGLELGAGDGVAKPFDQRE